MGLIQRMAEEAGICTISMGNMRARMTPIKPPRALLVKFARGAMMGEPGNISRQRRIILDAFDALNTMTEPGSIRKLPYQWKNRIRPEHYMKKHSENISGQNQHNAFGRKDAAPNPLIDELENKLDTLFSKTPEERDPDEKKRTAALPPSPQQQSHRPKPVKPKKSIPEPVVAPAERKSIPPFKAPKTSPAPTVSAAVSCPPRTPPPGRFTGSVFGRRSGKRVPRNAAREMDRCRDSDLTGNRNTDHDLCADRLVRPVSTSAPESDK